MTDAVLSRQGIGATPLATLLLRLRDRTHRVLLKLESENPTGSVKDRTAYGVVRAMHQASPLRPGDVVIESTSGNLGLALARVLGRIGCRFVAVTDPNTPERTRRLLEAAGAEVIVVDVPDGRGGYLLSRLRVVRELCEQHPEYRWSNQYENPANPAVHEQSTGPELVAQAGPALDAVYIAVSTGGTLAGVSRYLRRTAPQVRIVAVDAQGSLVTGAVPGPRLLSGIGASRPSRFLVPGCYDAATAIDDARAFALCRTLLQDTGMAIGGSGGSVLAACLADLDGADPPRLPLALVADGGGRYRQTFYDDAWLEQRRVLTTVEASEQRLRGAGVRFEFRPETPHKEH